MLKEMGTANCSIFAFDTREAGLVPSLFDYDETTFGYQRGAGRFLFTEGGVHQNPSLIFKDDRYTGMYPLTKLAKDTGGSYYSNINEYQRNLGQLQTMTGSFYVLGFPVSETWDGRFHALKVEVKRKGSEVRAQRGFYNPRPFGELSPLEKEFHLIDLALNEGPVFQAPLAASMTALAAPFGPDMNFSLVTRIPPETSGRLAGPKVEIVSFVFDDKDELAELRRTENDLSRLKDQAVFYASGGLMKSGTYRCRIVVRNLETGQAAVASARIFIAPPQTSGIRLHSLLLLSPAVEATYLEGWVNPAKGSPVNNLSSWTSLYSFKRSQFTPVLGPVPRDTGSVYGALPCTVLGIEQPLVALRASLVNVATAEKFSAPITLHDRINLDGTFIQALEIALSGVPPGSYVLYVYAEETTTKALSFTTATLTLR
jgi:hypothetical protein